MFKPAFSLIELLIVILIIGIVYTLAISGFDNLKKGKGKPTLANLVQYLSSIEHKSDLRLLCLDRCDSCSLIIDGEFDEEQSEKFDGFLDRDVKVYFFNINTGLQEVADSVYFNSEDVSQNICFSFELDKKGVSSQVIVEYKKNVYDFTNPLGNAKKYSSTSELIDAKHKLVNEVLQ